MQKIIAIVLIWFLFLGFIGLVLSNNGLEFTDTHTIKVGNGDTLWDIATNINDGSYNNNQLVYVLRDINDLDSALLRVGQELEVPVLEEVN